jgi:hypothetical protein
MYGELRSAAEAAAVAYFKKLLQCSPRGTKDPLQHNHTHKMTKRINPSLVSTLAGVWTCYLQIYIPRTLQDSHTPGMGLVQCTVDGWCDMQYTVQTANSMYSSWTDWTWALLHERTGGRKWSPEVAWHSVTSSSQLQCCNINTQGSHYKIKMLLKIEMWGSVMTRLQALLIPSATLTYINSSFYHVSTYTDAVYDRMWRLVHVFR